ncbi:putative methyltransferase DDB_G0268948 isoform X1 [Engystomops pustulosus]|uniref:putative methyltransferase DDB_G0268948 isoform X1 n=1 Tax=Engystomops pustulosus TaxID=76066 RepID=UPI003AFAB492
MATRLFEEKEHASSYQKYRFSPAQEIQDMIFSYLHEKLNKPYELAVDVGCGTGLSTKILSPHFKKVLGIDISKAQIEEAKNAVKLPNTIFRVSPAEEVPVDDASVDLLTACAAVHWFDIEKLLTEVDRILKPGGCLAFYTYTLNMELHYKYRSEQLTKLFLEVKDFLTNYQNEKMHHVQTEYKEIFDCIPYTDKLRIVDIVTKTRISVGDIIGFCQTLSAFRIYHRLEPENAKDYIKAIEKRFLDIMEVSSSETEVELWCKHVVLLASKPK